MKYLFVIFFYAAYLFSDRPLLGSWNLDDLDAVVYEALETFKTPGVAIGIVAGGKEVLAKGYGIRDLEKGYPVTEDTLFAIASGTKPFTSFLLGQLVDEGRLDWDDPVQMYIPEFRFCNETTGRQVSIRDLLAHCSGLPRHDMLWYNAPIKRAELIERLSLLEPNCSPGDKYQYNNMAFTVAGMVLERVTGQTWEEVLESRILGPLLMTRTNSSVKELEASSNYSLPYVWAEDSICAIDPRILLTAPSSSINSSISDMTKWLQVLLGQGSSGAKCLLSKKVFEEISSLQVENLVDSTFCFQSEGAGLGWSIGNYEGESVIYHGGYAEGFVSLTAVLPDQDIGLVLLCNTNSADFHLVSALTKTILHRLLGLEKCDWTAQERTKYEAKIADLPVYEQTKDTADYFQSFVGRYENPAYGDLELLYRDGCPLLFFHGLEFGLKYEQEDAFEVISLVPAYPQFAWSGRTSWNSSTSEPELHISFEPAADPIAFSSIFHRRQ